MVAALTALASPTLRAEDLRTAMVSALGFGNSKVVTEEVTVPIVVRASGRIKREKDKLVKEEKLAKKEEKLAKKDVAKDKSGEANAKSGRNEA
ncbi:unnamed protein product [Microthlaspi erraticum]|uniref:Uncharacterized protein n=1 Tax=Microthlaspi erraticum TaxID=1685480 RepID=A0A6D2I611_9BRAS|nr:unnamed protein product [Microthlaspi erraticum]